MSDQPQDPAEMMRKSRGAQLRALVLSWHLNILYQDALQEQALALQNEELEINEEWATTAAHILDAFTANQST